jgi:flavin-binding protein dodecin
MYTGEFGQFVYLVPGDASTAPAVDHFGLQVSTCEEIEETVAKAKKRQDTDDRVRVTDIRSRITRGPVHEYTLTSAYIGFVLPLTIELQNITRREP